MSAADEVQTEGDNEPNGAENDKRKPLLFKRHTQYFRRVLNILPSSLSSLDSNRMTLVFFALSGLDVLNSLDATLPLKEKEDIINWIYAQQILPDGEDEDREMSCCGFRGSSFIGAPFCPNKTTPCPNRIPYDTGHVAMSYTALSCLLILGDDLSRVYRPSILAGVKRLQLPNGSFYSTTEGSENDMRFIYCAACVSYILGDWSAIDIDKAVEFIRSSQNYDGGIGQGPCLESHGGSTFCGVAALSLMGRLDSTFSSMEFERLRKWCLFRQSTGFQGRPNKPVDTCYSFWIGASLELLGFSYLVDKDWNRSYVMSTQADFGGLSKWPDCNPDPLHTYLGLCGLSLNGEEGLRHIHPALNISQRAEEWLKKLQNSLV